MSRHRNLGILEPREDNKICQREHDEKEKNLPKTARYQLCWLLLGPMECQPKSLFNSWVYTPSSSLQKGQFQSHHSYTLKEGQWALMRVRLQAWGPPISLYNLWFKSFFGYLGFRPHFLMEMLLQIVVNTSPANLAFKGCLDNLYTLRILLENTSFQVESRTQVVR